jgi:hypothetical protein
MYIWRRRPRVKRRGRTNRYKAMLRAKNRRRKVRVSGRKH